jgi:hypothetical protein|tara:strand:- start:1497 stop:1835 length:339 start_codon:yes stop_codon:yes gene_type:complete
MNTKLSEIPVPAYAEIVDEWYRAMGENNISVQPKASTILGTILAKYDISPKQEIDPDVYEQYMNTTGGDFANFWKNLSDTEKAYVEEKRQQARDKFYSSRNLVDDKKTLLKG